MRRHDGPRLGAAIALLILLPALPAPAAPAAPADAGTARQQLVDLDGDGAPERLAIDELGALHVGPAAGGAEWGTVAPPPHGGTLGASTLAVVEAGGRKLVHARVALGGGAGGRALEEVALVEGRSLRTVASLVSGPQGPDGEWSLGLGVGAEGVVRYQRAPGVERCDGFDRLFAEVYLPGDGRWRPLPSPLPGGPEVPAVARVPALAQRPPLRLFRFVAASSHQGDDRRADRLAPPRELEDERPDSAWRPGEPGAFVTARAVAGAEPLEGVALLIAPGAAIDRLALLVDREVLRVPLRREAKPGRWLWVPLAGRRAACVSLVLDGAPAPTRATAAGLAEARIYTASDAASDGEGGVAKLIERAEQGGAAREALLEILATRPAAVAEALPGATPAGRRLLLRALAASSRAEAAGPLVAALPTARGEDRRLILEALAEGRPLAAAGREPLWRLALDRTVPLAPRREAIAVLGRGTGGAARAWRELVAGRLEEPPLAEAAVEALAAAPPAEALATVRAGGAAPPRGSLRLAHLRVLGTIAARARAAGAAPVQAGAVEALLALAPDGTAGDEGFEAAFRWLRAARQAASPLLLPVLERELAAEDEVRRWAAAEAVAALPGSAGLAALERALADGDPRVRQAALEGLAAGGAPDLAGRAARLLTGDAWPSVRRAAAERLSSGCPGAASRALVQAATSDPDALVATAALGALARCDAASAGPLALRLAVTPSRAFPRGRMAVRERAVALAAQLRPPGAPARLSEALMDLLDHPGADERVAGLAASMARALGRLRDAAGEPGLERALGEAQLPGLRAAAIEAIGALCTPRGRTVLAYLAGEEDSATRAAATRALATCR